MMKTSVKITLTAFGTAAMLVLATTVPSETALAVMPEAEREAHLQERQKFTTPEQEMIAIPVEAPIVEESEEWLRAEAARIEAERLASAIDAAKNSSPQVFRDVPPGVGAQGLVDAALAQVGVYQDCTDLVQNSLAAIGLTERREHGGYDLGTGIWQYDRYGTRVDINSLAPGDILIYGNAGSGAHVAIYIGDGQAVHGGYSGRTVIASIHSNLPLTGAIRV